MFRGSTEKTKGVNQIMTEKEKFSERSGITKRQSAMLQGIAVLMLIYHHFFNDLSVYFGDAIVFGWPGRIMQFAWFCKICVGNFAFVTGYGMSILLDQKKGPALAICLRRIAFFMIRYWIVFLLFMGCMFSMGRVTFKPKEFLENFFCITNTYNGAFWYVQQYVIMLLFLAIAEALWRFLEEILTVDRKPQVLGKHWLDAVERILALILVIAAIGVAVAVPFFWQAKSAMYKFLDMIRIAFVLVCFAGYFMAKFRVYDRLFQWLSSWPYLLRCLSGTALITATSIVRMYLADSPAYAKHDFILVPVFVMGILLVIRSEGLLGKLLERLGGISLYVWLTHLFVFDLTKPVILRFVHSHLPFYVIETGVCILIGSTCLWTERAVRSFPRYFIKK